MRRFLVSSLLLAASLVPFAAAPSLAEQWTLKGHQDFPYFDAAQSGLHLTQGLAWNEAKREWVASWRFGFARLAEDFTVLQSTGKADGTVGDADKIIGSGMPEALANQGIDHIGDIDVQDGVIYAAVDSGAAEFFNGHVALFSADDLSYLGKMRVLIGPESNRRSDVASWIALDPATGRGYGKEWQEGTTINVYDAKGNWKFLDTLKMDRPLKNIQGGKVFQGALYLSSDNETRSIYRVDLANGQVEELAQLEGLEGAHEVEMEGVALRALPDGGAEMYVELILNPGDAAQLDAYVRLFHFVRN